MYCGHRAAYSLGPVVSRVSVYEAGDTREDSKKKKKRKEKKN
jgi:hypothetical protein